PPRRLVGGTPRDLETICLKCLHKEPHRRYQSAADLAGDLHAFLDGRPIKARPVGVLGRLAKWARRRPAAASLVAVSVLGALVLVAGGGWFTWRLDQARQLADDNATLAESNAREANDLARSARANEEAARAALRQAEEHRAVGLL